MNLHPRRLCRIAALVAIVALSLPATARDLAQKKQLAETLFEKAERMREALAGTPAKDRTRRDYQRAIDEYRKVYYVAPTSFKADPSVVAAAELCVGMGRVFSDPKAFRQAIGQYEFLRREYPGSKHHVEALFTIAEIYRQDLQDEAAARSAYQEFLNRYPHSHLAEQARAALAEIDKPSKTARTREEPAAKVKDKQAGREEDQDRSASASAAIRDLPEPKPVAASRRTRLPLVTGIRHWSTPDYTRIAIDLEEQVKYEAGRVPRPDRIFFDLHDTRLAPELVGKSFDVEDGFLRKIRVAQYQRGLTRVVLEVDDVSDYSAFFLPNPYRLIVDIHGKQPKTERAKRTPAEPAVMPAKIEVPATAPGNADATQTIAPAAKGKPPKIVVDAEEDDPLPAGNSARQPKGAKEVARESPRSGDAGDDTVQVAKLNPPEVKATTRPTTAPTYESVAPRAKSRKGKRSSPEPDPNAREAKPTSNGEQTLIRALGLKIGRIVVDAGHGGHDTGTIGPHGLMEKDLVLDVALRLGKLLETRMGADVVYTREDDTFIPLETRTAIANQQQSDLFISIHANSSRDPSARGIETYYLNFTSSPDALEVAARENAVSDKSIHELQDLVKKIALKEKIEESREFAANVQRSLQTSPAARGTRDRGVKKAPFIVLIGANMPSILAEISFLSNPSDERKLSTPEYRQKIAEALYRGIAKYVSGLSGVKLANKMAKESGQ